MTKPIIKISSTLKETILKEKSYQKEIDSIASEISLLTEEIGNHEINFGWQERHLSGFFGGDRELVKSVDKKREKLAELEKRNTELAKALKQINDTVKKELTECLASVDEHFSAIIDRKNKWLDLERKSKSYHNLVLRSHQGIIDALLFASWDKLINHTEAKAKLAEFKAKTARYQSVVSVLSEEIRSITGELVIFENYIKFSSQQVAMDSFKMLSGKSKAYQNLAYDQVEDFLAAIDRKLEEVKLEIV